MNAFVTARLRGVCMGSRRSRICSIDQNLSNRGSDVPISDLYSTADRPTYYQRGVDAGNPPFWTVHIVGNMRLSPCCPKTPPHSCAAVQLSSSHREGAASSHIHRVQLQVRRGTEGKRRGKAPKAHTIVILLHNRQYCDIVTCLVWSSRLSSRCLRGVERSSKKLQLSWNRYFCLLQKCLRTTCSVQSTADKYGRCRLNYLTEAQPNSKVLSNVIEVA